MTRRPRLRPAHLPLVLLLAVAVAAPWLAPYDPASTDGPSGARPSGTHLLGTTPLGQDVLSRLMYGARSTVLVAGSVALICVLLGGVIGAAAGALGRVWDRALRHLIDLVLVLPRLPLLLVITALASPSAITMVLAVSALGWAPVARVSRAYVAGLHSAEHIEAARGFGAGRWYVVRRHAVPRLTPVLLAEAVTVAASAVLLESTLGFLGLAPADRITWGGDLHRVLSEPGVLTSSEWVWWAAPFGLAVACTIAAVIALGSTSSVRDARLRGLA